MGMSKVLTWWSSYDGQERTLGCLLNERSVNALPTPGDTLLLTRGLNGSYWPFLWGAVVSSGFCLLHSAETALKGATKHVLPARWFQVLIFPVHSVLTLWSLQLSALGSHDFTMAIFMKHLGSLPPPSVDPGGILLCLAFKHENLSSQDFLVSSLSPGKCCHFYGLIANDMLINLMSC